MDLSGIARIIRPSPPVFEHVGMAIVIDDNRVLTCAHVINLALSLPVNSEKKPSEEISVIFPFSGSGSRIPATVEHWCPPSERPGDIAILQLAEKVPPDISPVQFARDNLSLTNERLRTCGYSKNASTIRHVNLKSMGIVEGARVQVDGDSEAFVKQGFSGAAVWHGLSSTVVGMVQDIDSTGDRIARFITTSALKSMGINIPTSLPNIRSSFVSIDRQKGIRLREDSISQFCFNCRDQFLRNFDLASSFLKATEYAEYCEGDGRYFYIWDVLNKINRIAGDEDEAPLSYEIYVPERKLINSVKFEVALLYDCDFDEHMFGNYQAAQRKQNYLNELEKVINIREEIDFLRIGMTGHVELGYQRTLIRVSDEMLRDVALGAGSESTAQDILNLKTRYEQTVTDIIFDVRRKVC
jgi:hypothetical protein